MMSSLWILVVGACAPLMANAITERTGESPDCAAQTMTVARKAGWCPVSEVTLRTVGPVSDLSDCASLTSRHARVWTPPLMQAFSLDGWGMRSGASVCPASRCGMAAPRACMEMRGSGPNRTPVLERTPGMTGFPDPVSSTICPYPILRPARTVPGLPCVDAPVDAKHFLWMVGACGQVLPCVRPLDAAWLRRGPVWRCADRVQIGLPCSSARRA